MRVFFGPNPYASWPVVVAEMVEIAAGPIDPARVWRRLASAFPQWMDDCPAADNPTHALALIAASWCKGLLNSVRGLIPGAGAGIAENGAVALWVGFHDPQITRRAIELSALAIRAASAAAPQLPDAELAAAIDTLQGRCRHQHPDYIARILMLGAQTTGTPFLKSPMGPRLWQYGWGCKGRVFLEASPLRDGFGGIQIAGNKARTVQFLSRLGFPVPLHRLASSLEEALQHADKLGWPLVVKPVDQGQGRGVTVGVRSPAAMARAFALVRRHSGAPAVIERVVPGSDHRLLVVRGQLVAAARRDPPTVIGNGSSAIHELMAEINAYRRSQPLLARYLEQIEAGPEVQEHLAEQGYELNSIPAAGQTLTLRGNANVSTGGTPTDVLNAVHPDIRLMAESVAVNLGLDCVGVDYITDDIGRSWRETGGCIVEVNATPGLDLHVTATRSEAVVGTTVLGPEVGRIPLVVVVAALADQRALLCKLEMHHPSSPAGLAILGPDCTRIGGLKIERGDALLPARVVQILANRQACCAVLCVTAQEIERFGLPVDRCDLLVLRSTGLDSDPHRTLLRGHSTALVDATTEPDWPSKRLLDRIVTTLAVSPEQDRL